MKKIVFVLLVALAFSCGDNKKEQKVETNTETKADKPAFPTSTAEAKDGVIVIEGNDQMKFNKTEIRVKAGEKITLTLKHVGKMEKAVMGHNWALLAAGADVATIGNAAAMEAENDYIPAEYADQILVHTKMIGGGESDTIEFEAPTEPGTYTFMCTFPGHYALMQGKFIVE